jgi:uncharacterized protein
MGESRRGIAFNKTRQSFLATDIRVADTHWTRLRGLVATNPDSFTLGQGLWILPCHGVHSWFMRFPIDAIYLDQANNVVHVEENLKPWRFAKVCMDSASVLEVPARTIWHSGTKVGDQIEFKFENRNGKEAA